MKIIGREKEKRLLQACFDSGRPEFVAVYGRRRIGKTYLVRQFFEDRFDFYMTGAYNSPRAQQLSTFAKQLSQAAGAAFPTPGNWNDAFDQLKIHLKSQKKKRVVVFIDELPWLDTRRSGFITALELFWNSWGCMQPQLMLIVCGSATTWMTDKLINGHGGLHNRITRGMHLSPFTLHECELYLQEAGIRYNRYQIAENYMAMGGIPYYLSLLDRSLSMSQNIDALYFTPDAPLRREYDSLFRSLFNDAELYRSVVEVISRKNKGLTLREIKKELKLQDSGRLTEVLKNLISCDFLDKYYSFGKVQRDAIYQLTDLYTLFYLRFVNGNNPRDEHRWTNMLDNPARTAWSGYAFEQVCLQHVSQIKRRLGIAGVLTDVCSWFNEGDDGHRDQIDLVIDRRDQVINLCEIKFSRAPFELSRKYIELLNTRLERFRTHTGTRKALHLTMLTTYGLAPNQYSGMIQSEVVLDDLFDD